MAFYLFIPGGLRAKADRDQVRAILAEQGLPSKAITLSDPQHSTLEDHIAQTLRAMAETPQGPVILVGHSYASFVITGAASRAPRNLSGLVYVDSSIPRSGQSLQQVFSEAGFNQADFSVPAWPPFIEPLVFDQSVIDGLPKTYIRCRQSQFRELTAGMAARLQGQAQGQPWRYYEIDADHYCMLNQPQELARLLMLC